MQAEYHHMVARLNEGVAAHEHSAAVTHESGDGEITAQFQVLDRCSGDTVALLDDDLCHLGVG